MSYQWEGRGHTFLSASFKNQLSSVELQSCLENITHEEEASSTEPLLNTPQIAGPRALLGKNLQIE